MPLRDFARHFSGKWLLLIFVAAAAVSLVSRYGMSVDGPRNTKAGTIKVETVATGLSHPWGLAFLPDGRMLVTERSGTLRLVSKDGKLSEPLSGVPKVVAAGQGGLLDVAIDPDFKSNSLVYLTYSEPGEGGAGTAVARGKLGESGLDGVEVIFRQEPKVEGGNHFGSRLVFAPDGKLFVTLGERFTFDPAQDLTNDLGKIVRINPDGSVPERQSLRRHVQTPVQKSGPTATAIRKAPPSIPRPASCGRPNSAPGGDELNIPQAGANYGWPVVSWGNHYTGEDIPDPPTHPEFADAIYHWNPVISPSGITFYTADAIPAWKGNLLIAGLSEQAIVRLTLDGEKVVDEERIPMGARIRDVVQGPDGAVYALTDEGNGEILRLTLENSPK